MEGGCGSTENIEGVLLVISTGRSFADMPPQKGSLDWLLVPVGIGTREGVKTEVLLSYIRGWCDQTVGLSLVMSVCTGCALLAAAGVLDGRCVWGLFVLKFKHSFADIAP